MRSRPHGDLAGILITNILGRRSGQTESSEVSTGPDYNLSKLDLSVVNEDLSRFRSFTSGGLSQVD